MDCRRLILSFPLLSALTAIRENAGIFSPQPLFPPLSSFSLPKADSSIHTSAAKSPTPLPLAIYEETLATSYKVRNLFAIALPGYHATLLLLLQVKFTNQNTHTQTPTLLSYNHF